MFLKPSEGIFKPQFRRQLFVTLSVTLLAFCHGIVLGWMSPMVGRLLSAERTPLDFSIDVSEASWLGSFISVGALIGNFSFAFIMNRFGRKAALLLLAVPHMCFWLLVYFARSIEWLFVARLLAGSAGGGSFMTMPIFIGEIADNSIRGRLCSIFTLAINMGILAGFIIASKLAYHLIPLVVIALPLGYLLLWFYYPETPAQLLRFQRVSDAEQSLKFYRAYEAHGTNKEAELEFRAEFDELRHAIAQQSVSDPSNNVGVRDFFNKRAVKAFLTGFILMIMNQFSGAFALINYMSTVFAAVKTEIDPDTNTIIIGVVQIIGTVASLHLVDRYGRKILLIVSSAGMALGMGAFGLYAFYAEETNADLTAFSSWLPLLLVAVIILLANIGILPVGLVVLVEILPAKIRSQGTSICLGALSCFAFTSLKSFPVLMANFGLAATIWFCSTVCAFGLFYISVFLVETKGKSMNEVENEH